MSYLHKCTKFDFRWVSAPDPARGANSARGGRGRGEESGGKGREGMLGGDGKKGGRGPTSKARGGLAGPQT